MNQNNDIGDIQLKESVQKEDRRLSIGETIMKVDSFAGTMQVCLDGGIKKILESPTSAIDIGTVSAVVESGI